MRSFATCVASLVITATAFDFVSDDGGEAALAVGSGVPAGWPTAWWKESWSSTCSGEPTAERLHYQCEPGVAGNTTFAVTCNQTHAIQRVFENEKNETCSTDSTMGVVVWERSLCEDGHTTKCDVPTPPYILKTSSFNASNCSGDALQIVYTGATLGCNLPPSNNTEENAGIFELDGVNITSNKYLPNDTNCSGESSDTETFQRNVCTVENDENFIYDFYPAPVKDQTTCKEAIDALDLNCSVDFVRDPAKNTTTCGVDATCTNELCCKGKDKKESGAFPSAPLAGMLVALCLHVGSAFA